MTFSVGGIRINNNDAEAPRILSALREAVASYGVEIEGGDPDHLTHVMVLDRANATGGDLPTFLRRHLSDIDPNWTAHLTVLDPD